jgi:type IV pilus assembly protein PilN
MRYRINLATQPYEDAGVFYRKWIPILAVLFVLAFGLSAKAFTVFRDSRRADREIASIEDRLAQLEKQRQQASATLARPENSGTRDAAEYLNGVFRLKQFSWTNLMRDLEQVVPAGVQVTSIKPQLNGDSREFVMEVATPQRDRVIELVRRMESAPQFANAEISSESTDDKGFKAIVTAAYAPVEGK